MVVAPVDAEKEKTQHVAHEGRDQRTQRGQLRAVGHGQFQNHDGDDDGDDAIAERFQPSFTHCEVSGRASSRSFFNPAPVEPLGTSLRECQMA